MRSRLAAIAALMLMLGAHSAHARPATCCISSSETCPGTQCDIPNVGAQCPEVALSKDCGGPYYCSFDYDLGCLTTNPCTAGKWTAVAKAVRRALKCDTTADASGSTVDPACTNKALDALPAAFAVANALGPCPGTASTLQNDIITFESKANTAVGNAGAPRTASRCDAEKVAALGSATARTLACMAKTARTAVSPFVCIGGASRHLGHAVARADGGADCSNSSRGGDLQDHASYPFGITVADHLASPSGAFLDGSSAF